MATNNPQVVTVRGRLSWPNLTYAAALKQNLKSKPQYIKKEEDVKPSFSLLVEQDQLDKLVAHIRDVFLPWAEEQGKQTPPAKSAFTAHEAKKIRGIIDEQDWENEPLTGFVTAVHEKTVPMAPEAVASVKVNGFKGQDLDQKAVVRNEGELRNPATELIIPERGLILPINDTTHDLYPGSICAATINLYGYVTNKVPGITASTSSVIFLRDAARFGGGGEIDEDEIFMDLDD